MKDFYTAEDIPNETLAYARERARSTRHSYIISGMLHVQVDHPTNRMGMEDCGGVIATISPTDGLPDNERFCMGNPTKADCIDVGYCRREIACND